MYWPDLHRLIVWLTRFGTGCHKALKWLVSSQGITVACLVVGAIAVCIAYGPSLPGCGGPISPLPTPAATATPEPTPTLPLPPVSPLETPGAGW